MLQEATVGGQGDVIWLLALASSDSAAPIGIRSKAPVRENWSAFRSGGSLRIRGARPGADGLPSVRENLAWGPGPRAAQALMLATRARAVLDGRLSPSLDDVLALAAPVLRHRMALSFAARADGVKLADVIAELKASLG